MNTHLLSSRPGSLLCLLGISVFLGLNLGCGDSRLAPVSGVVTLDGKPVANVVVSFQPASEGADPDFNPGSGGTTDVEGRYELSTREGNGAVVGEHTVTLVYRDPDLLEQPLYDEESGREVVREFKLPPRARDGSLKATVPQDGTDAADFAFESSEIQDSRRNGSRL